MEREQGGNKQAKPGKAFNEKEWVERFTKKEEKKNLYTDPNNTFKP